MTDVDVYEYFTASAVVFKLKAQGKAHFNLDFTDANSCRADGGKIWVKVRAKAADGGKEGWLDLSKLSFTASYTFTAGPVNARVNTAMDAAIMGKVPQNTTITISALMCDASGNVWGKIASADVTLNNFWVRMDGTDKVTVLTTTDVVTGTTGYGYTSHTVDALYGGTSTVAYTLAAGTRVSFSGKEYETEDSWIAISANGIVAYIQKSDLASFALSATANVGTGATIYQSPDATAPVTTTLDNGTLITIVGESGDFWQLADGYIAKTAVTINP